MFRGSNGQPVFVHDDDRRRFVDRLSDAVTKHGCRFHAFCLMSNHVHLANQEGETPLSKVVQSITQRHAVPSRGRDAAQAPAVAGWVTPPSVGLFQEASPQLQDASDETSRFSATRAEGVGSEDAE